MRIVLTADHAGVDLKDELAGWLEEQGHDILDLGTHGPESVDYPRFGALMAEALADGRAERGITICGSGIGVAIAANRNPACRCAVWVPGGPRGVAAAMFGPTGLGCSSDPIGAGPLPCSAR